VSVLDAQAQMLAPAQAEVLALEDPAALAPADRLRAEEYLSVLAKVTAAALDAGLPNPDILLDADVRPTCAAWMQLRKHAIALHPLYRAPLLNDLGGGLNMADLESELPGLGKPFELLAGLIGPQKAERVQGRYAQFLGAPFDDEIRLLMQGTLDSAAIRWRAAAAAELARQHACRWSSAVRLTSLACGAAAPVAQLADQLRAQGQDVDRLTLVDRDPVALAAGRAIAAAHVGAEHVVAEMIDLVDLSTFAASNLAGPLGTASAHLVDVLGLFEYLPDVIAVDLLRKIRPILTPDGAIVLANMLTPRPQQFMFEHVIQWPALVQRSLDDLRHLFDEAGFAADQVRLVVPPPAEAIYAVALLTL
jgi:SAM-dependent methyltransferase